MKKDGSVSSSAANPSPIGQPRLLYRLGTNERVSTDNCSALYRSICPHCGSGSGRLTAVPRNLSARHKSDLFYTGNGVHLVRLMSERLRDLLVDLGLSADDFCLGFDGAGTAIFELRPECLQVPFVPLKEAIGIRAKAVRCPVCGATSFVFAHRKFPKGTLAYVRESELVGDKKVYIGGTPGTAEPLLSASGYVSLLQRGTLDAKAFENVGVVPDSDVEEHLVATPLPRRN